MWPLLIIGSFLGWALWANRIRPQLPQTTGTLVPGKLYQIEFDVIAAPPVAPGAQVSFAEQISLAMSDHGFRLVGGLQSLPSLPIGTPTPTAPQRFMSQGIWTGDQPISIASYLSSPLASGRFIRIRALATIQPL